MIELSPPAARTFRPCLGSGGFRLFGEALGTQGAPNARGVTP